MSGRQFKAMKLVIALLATLLPTVLLAQSLPLAAPSVGLTRGDVDLAVVAAREPASDDRRCLALAIAYEAGNEPVEGQEAVAQVILNRKASGVYPASICGVVFQGAQRRTGCQFTFTCDGALQRWSPPSRIMSSAEAIADRALSGALGSSIGDATHYHADYVAPRWRMSLERVAQIGAHIFYRMRDGRSGPGAALAAVSPAPTLPSATAFSPWGLDMATLRTSARKGLEVTPGAAVEQDYATR